jgi:hypothetical protein
MRYLLATLLAALFLSISSRVVADGTSDYQAARAQYIQRAAFLFRQNLDPRMYRRSADVEAVVVLHFSGDGRFQNVSIQERSGDNAFDTAVEFALRKTIPVLPAPPMPPGSEGPFAIAVRICSLC